MEPPPCGTLPFVESTKGSVPQGNVDWPGSDLGPGLALDHDVDVAAASEALAFPEVQHRMASHKIPRIREWGSPALL